MRSAASGWRRDREPLATSLRRPGCFAEFYDALAPQALGFFARRTDNRQAALDLTAETFALAYEKRAEFRGRSDKEAAGWFWSIARRELADFWRDRARELAAVERLGLQRPIVLEDSISRVDEALSWAGSRDAVRSAVETLPDMQREAILLRIVEEFSYDEISEALAVSGDVVRARVSRGLRALAAHDDGALALHQVDV